MICLSKNRKRLKWQFRLNFPYISLSEGIVVYFPFRMWKPRRCVEKIRVVVILCYPSGYQNLQKLESFLGKIWLPQRWKNSELICWVLDKQSNLCAAGTLHAQSDKVHTSHVSQFTEMLWTKKALKRNETQVLTPISTGDVTTNELYYLKKCLMRFNNQYSAAIKQETATPDIPRNFLRNFIFEK